MAVTVGGTALTFNNNTLQQSVAYPSSVATSVTGTFNATNTTYAWAGDVLTTFNINNSVTKAAYASGRKVVITKAVISERINSGSSGSSSTLSTSHTACWVLEVFDGVSWLPFASSFHQYNAGTYYGFNYSIPRTTHVCVVGQPETTTGTTWMTPFMDGPINFNDCGISLTSETMQFRVRLYTLATNTSPFESVYSGTVSAWSRVGSSSSMQMISDPTTGSASRGLYTFANPSTGAGEERQYSHLRIQNTPGGVLTDAGAFRLNMPSSIAVAVSNTIQWSFSGLVSIAVRGD